MPPSPSGSLCTQCGLCCDGTLFGRVELLLADDVEGLKAHGFRIVAGLKPRFAQPCPALAPDCTCRIYAQRPQQCRAFDCALLLRVQSGEVGVDAAERLVRRTRKQAARVRELLEALGDRSRRLPLSQRFSRLRRRLEAEAEEGSKGVEERWDLFAELTLAVHELQRQLRQDFYP
jgi:Fe-S-cluster containining protein